MKCPECGSGNTTIVKMNDLNKAKKNLGIPYINLNGGVRGLIPVEGLNSVLSLVKPMIDLLGNLFGWLKEKEKIILHVYSVRAVEAGKL